MTINQSAPRTLLPSPMQGRLLRLSASALGFVSVFMLGGVLAQAQPESMMLPSSGRRAAPAQPTPAPAPAPAPSAEQSATGQGAGQSGGGSMPYGEFLEGSEDDGRTRYHLGNIPATHTIRSGDTLWTLASYYYRNGWDWPKIWGINPEITNPHSIYPGNIVRLRKGGMVPTAMQASGTMRKASMMAPSQGVGLRQLAYVDLEELEDAGRVVGSVDEKQLLSEGDSVYIKYPSEEKRPKVGQEFAIYTEGRKIKRKGKAVGTYVKVAGQLRVTYSKKDKRARAVLTRSVAAVERGMRVGPLSLNFADVVPQKNEVKLAGNIVDLISPDYLIGADMAVIIDRGSDDGVKAGNSLLVVRGGDAYQSVLKPGDHIGQDDKDYPQRAIAQLMVVQSEKKASVAIVTFSLHEFGVGDRVLMRKDK